MFLHILIFAAALTQASGTPATALAATISAPAAAPVSRGLKDLPNTNVTYYDVQGRTGPAIEKSWKKLLNDPASKDSVELFTWKVGAQVSKRTEGEKCTVASAKSTLTANVRLPRLAEEANVSKEVLTAWQKNIGAAESDAAANLWFVSDRLSGVDQSMVGLPCDQATPAWNAGLEKLKLELTEFAAQRAKASMKPAGASRSDSVIERDR